MAQSGNSGDVSTTLSELERKLRELEQELARVGRPDVPAPAPAPPAPAPVAVVPAAPIAAVPAPAPPAPAPIAAAPPAPELPSAPSLDTKLADIEAQLERLRRYGDDMQASAGRLLDAYRGALAEVQPSAVAAPVPEAPPLRVPIAQGHQVPPDLTAHFERAQAAREQAQADAAAIAAVAAAQAAADAQAAHAAAHAAHEAAVARAAATQAAADAAPVGYQPAPVAYEPPPAAYAAVAIPAAHAAAATQVYIGAITVDAGPFSDIASLSEFEQALARVPGVRDVYVRGFQGERAIVDVDFSIPTELVPELAAVSSLPFTVNGSDATGLVVTIGQVSENV